MRLYLVRHGQTDWNVSGKAQGHTDIALNAEGRTQAQLLARHLGELPIEQIVCSDLVRCRETLAPSLPTLRIEPEYRTDLRERGFGDWEGNHFTEVHHHMNLISSTRDISLTAVRPPNGESFEDVWVRVSGLVQTLFETDANVLVVSHGGTLGVLLARMLQGGFETSRAFRFENTAITELKRRPEGQFMLIRYANTDHLMAEAALAEKA